MSDPAQMFRSVDKDGSGTITGDELQRLLSQMNLTYSLGFCSSLIRLFDDSRSGRLFYHNWMTLHAWLGAVQNAFRSSDRDNSGTLNFTELYSCLASLDLHLDQTPFNKLCETFDVGRKNQLGLAEFIGVCAFLKASKAVFIAFDQARTGRITLDFNQFCYAAAHTR